MLACNENDKKMFPQVLIIDLKNNKNLKSHLMIAALPDINELGRWDPCGGKRPPCQLCSNMDNRITFKSKHSNEVYQVSKMVILLVEFRVCGR